MSIIVQYGDIFLILACVFGVFMAWGVGANDVANAMGTSVGAKALTVRQAIVIAVIFEFCGAYLAGGEVTSTIRKGIVDASMMVETPEYLVYGMMASLLAAGTWLLIASCMGWPVSTTHSIVGAIIGFTTVGISSDAVAWGKVGQIVVSWIASPVLAGVISFCLFRSVQKLIMNTPNPYRQAQRYLPFYMFTVGFLIAMVSMLKGLKHVFNDFGIELTFLQCAGIAFVLGLLVTALGIVLLQRTKQQNSSGSAHRFAQVENLFAVLMIFTACAMAFAHGSNDVANAVGPLAAIVAVVQSGAVEVNTVMPSWILLLGGLGIVIGLVTYGFKVMATIGRKITELTPSRGFAAELGAAATVVLASGTGIPVSTTHTLVGAVLGVGCARGIGAINLRVVGTIFISWVATLPAGAGLAILFFFFFKGIFSA